MLYPEDRVPTIPSNPQPLESPYGCPFDFPPDEYSQFKIEHNPYARAFQDSIPSESTSKAAKKGGYVRSPTITVSPPRHQSLPSFNAHINEESDTTHSSVESGNFCANT